MALFNGGRMVALFLCVLFALNTSFAQEDEWTTVVFYMVDPIEEKVSQGVKDYIEKWNDPLTWETFERDFTPAREAQQAQVTQDSLDRLEAAKEFLQEDLRERGDGTSTWYPAWIPLALSKGDKEVGVSSDSLFKNILEVEGPLHEEGAQAGRRLTLRQFIEGDGFEPDGLDADGKQKYQKCNPNRRRCRTLGAAVYSDLLEKYDASQTSATAPRIISFAVRVRRSEGVQPLPGNDLTFVGEQNEEGITKPKPPGEGTLPSAEFDYDSIRLLQPAAMDPDIYVIDTPPYKTPAAKPVSSTEASSWGRIKATFAD